jgi:2-polyprenyl-3-methyl-5-hydroxy-6-metoxy-1,4-benzoquinol methylase
MTDDKLSFLKSQLKFPQSIYNGPKWKLVLKYVKMLGPGASLLDIGFGYPFLNDFIGKEYNVYGMDVQEEALRGLDPQRYKYGNIQDKIPFEDKSFDGVVMLELIEHLSNMKAAFSEIKRVLKPGGIIIMSTPNYSFLPGLFWAPVEATYFRLFAKGYSKIEEHHTNKYSRHKLDKELAGFFGDYQVKTFGCGLGLFASCKNSA